MKRISIIFLSITILFLVASCAKEDIDSNTTTENISIESTTTIKTTESITTITETEPSTKPTIYEYDDVINDFLNKYNELYPKAKITSKMITKDYHHGREHDNQIILDICDDVGITISSTYVNGGEDGISVFIDIYNHSDMSNVKEMYMLFTKVFIPNVSEDKLESNWSVFENAYYSETTEIDNVEFMFAKGSYLEIEGSF